MNDCFNRVLFQILDVVFFKKALKQKNPLFPAAAACSDGVTDIDCRKAVGVGESRHRVVEPVTVGVGFDNGPHIAPVRGFTHPGKVVPQCFHMNGDGNRTGHGLNPSQ